MAFIPIKIDRTTKPPVGTPLRSDGHWSVQGLAGAFDLSQGSGKTAPGSTGLLATTVGGGPLQFTPEGADFGDYVALNVGKIVPTTGPLTFIVESAPHEIIDTSKQVVIGLGDRATFRYFNTYYGHFFTYNGSSWDQASIAGYFPLGVFQTIACVHDPVNLSNKTYVNGTPSGGIIASPRNSPSQLDTYIGGDSENTDRRFDGLVRWALIYNKALSEQEVKSISENPWQIFEPEVSWYSSTIINPFTQYSYRFYNDDGSESASTPIAGENININRQQGNIVRLRTLLDFNNTTNDNYQIEYRRKSSGVWDDWRKIL